MLLNLWVWDEICSHRDIQDLNILMTTNFVSHSSENWISNDPMKRWIALKWIDAGVADGMHHDDRVESVTATLSDDKY